MFTLYVLVVSKFIPLKMKRWQLIIREIQGDLGYQGVRSRISNIHSMGSSGRFLSHSRTSSNIYNTEG